MVNDLGEFEMLSNKELNTIVLNALLPVQEDKNKVSRQLEANSGTPEAKRRIDPVLSLDVVYSSDGLPASDIGFDWVVTAVDDYKLTFQIDFDDPILVSNSIYEYNSLKVTILEELAFTSKEGSPLNPKYKELGLMTSILRQRLSEGGVLQQLAASGHALAVTVFLVSFVLFFATRTNLQYLLHQIAMLQNIVYFPGFNFLVPANVIHYFGMFQPLVTFYLHLFEKWTASAYELTPTEPLNQ